MTRGIGGGGHIHGRGSSVDPNPDEGSPVSSIGSSDYGRDDIAMEVENQNGDPYVFDIAPQSQSMYDAHVLHALVPLSGSSTATAFGTNHAETPMLETQHVQQGVSTSTASSSSEPQIAITVTSDGLFSSSKCARKMTATFKTRVDLSGYVWKKVTQATRDYYWREFKKAFTWDPQNTTAVKSAYEKNVGEHYGQFLGSIRREFYKRNQVPSYVPSHIWKEWLTRWSDPKWIVESQQNSKNCKSNVDGAGPACHTVGSISFSKVDKRLERKWQRKPFVGEIHTYSQTKKNDGKTFINERSKKVHDKWVEMVAEKSQPLPGFVEAEPSDKNPVFFEAIGGEKKRRVCGVGSMARSLGYIGGSLTTTYASTVDLAVVEQRLVNIREQMTSLEEARELDRQRHLEKLAAHNRRYEDELSQFRQCLEAEQKKIQDLQNQFQQQLMFQQQIQQLLSSGVIPNIPSHLVPQPFPPLSDDAPKT